MAAVNEILADCFGRVRESVHAAVSGLSVDQLTWRPAPQANTIAWLAWHLTRIQDDHVAGVAGAEQVWETGGWAKRFDLPFDLHAIGYGQSTAEVGKVRVGADLLTGYYDAVHSATLAYVEGLAEDDFARIVDERWDPPVTLAVRLVSVVNDDMQHVGQAAYLRGLVDAQS